MSKHTKGPWRAIRLPRGDHKIDAKGWKELATVYGNEDRELARQGAANARLISAAPELLEALRVALGAMQANIAYATRKDEHALARGIDVARAAIAKATGGEP